jgi:hypothetical protein
MSRQLSPPPQTYHKTLQDMHDEVDELFHEHHQLISNWNPPSNRQTVSGGPYQNLMRQSARPEIITLYRNPEARYSPARYPLHLAPSAYQQPQYQQPQYQQPQYQQQQYQQPQYQQQHYQQQQYWQQYPRQQRPPVEIRPKDTYLSYKDIGSLQGGMDEYLHKLTEQRDPAVQRYLGGHT